MALDAKRGGRNKKVNTIDKKQESFSIIIALFTLYTAALGGTIKVLHTLSLKIRFTQIATVGEKLFGFILLILFVLILLNWIIVGICGIAEIHNHFNPKNNKFIGGLSYALKKLILTSFWSSFSNISVYALLLLILIWFFNFYFIMVFLFFVIISLSIMLFVKKKKKENFIEWFRKQSNKKNGRERKFFVLVFSLILSGLMLLLIITNLVMISSIQFNFVFDKSFYFNGDDVYLQIYPSGLSEPFIQKITYSNNGIPIDYMKNDIFKGSPVYLKINSSILRTESYNSFVTVWYDVPIKFAFLRKNMTKSEFVPVFNYSYSVNKSIENTPELVYIINQTQQNATCIKNYYFS